MTGINKDLLTAGQHSYELSSDYPRGARCTSLSATLLSALLALSGPLLASVVRAETTTGTFPVEIRVDAAQHKGALRPIWRFFGADEPNYATMRDGRKLLVDLGALRAEGTFFRTHNLLNTGDGQPALRWGSTDAYTEDAQGNPIYDWSTIDRIFDTYLQRGVRPYAQIGFMPKALSSQPEPYQHRFPHGPVMGGWSAPPKDYEKWAELVYQWVTHCVRRYGAEEVEKWYWEVWNEPNIGYWRGTPEEFYKLHDYAIDAVRRALPTARVGGPDVWGDGGKFMEGFKEHVVHGTNYATGKKGTPTDFLSFHAKGAPVFVDGHVRMGIGTHLRTIDAGFAALAAVPELKNKPIVIGESDPDGCAACLRPENSYRNGTMYSSYTAASFARKHELADRHGVNLDGALTWAFEFEGQPFFAGFRTLSTNGVALPVLNVFRMFAKMGGERIEAASSAHVPLDKILKDGVSSTADVAALASRDGRTVSVMVWHYHDDDLPGPDAAVELAIDGLGPVSGAAQLTHYRIDEHYSNSYAEWKRLGSPLAPNEKAYAAIEQAGQLARLGAPENVEIDRGRLTLKFSLPRQAVSLLVLELPTLEFPIIPFDASAVRPGPVQVASTADAVIVQWPDETGRRWKAEFSLSPWRPLITAISVGDVPVITRALPYYQVSTGKRRGGWDRFFDFPPSHPGGTRSFRGRFVPAAARATTVGDRVELEFDGLDLGIFQGSIRYVFFPHSRLIEQAAVVSTQEEDTAYFYDAGLTMIVDSDAAARGGGRPTVSYFDTQGVVRDVVSADPQRQPLAVRYRTIAARAGGGSVAVFPAPHRYFFPRDFTTNQGYVWHAAPMNWENSVPLSLGVRQAPEDGTAAYPWSNAPPGTEQRMSLFLLVQSGSAHAALSDVARFTNYDRFPALDGYKTFTSHWHFAYTMEAMAKGMEWTPPFKTVLKDMGVQSALIMDFHGDGHPKDSGDVRLRELHDYYEVCRKQSDPDFLLIPAEEANVHFGGHWGIAFPKPVYWRMNRTSSQEFSETDAKYGKVYNVGNASEMLDLVRRENGFAYQTHPRTKASTGFPDRVRDTAHFQDDHYFGVGWKALPSDLSSPRLGERVFRLLDDMADWGLKKRAIGEVDVYKVEATHELYAHMNVNYVRMSALPSFDDYGQLLDALRRGDFFVSTGEVLLSEVQVAEAAPGRIAVRARIKNTFPLQMAEVVWSDGSQIHRKTFPLTTTHPFSDIPFSAEVEAAGWKWARFAVWDIAANGAFINPVWKTAGTD